MPETGQTTLKAASLLTISLMMTAAPAAANTVLPSFVDAVFVPGGAIDNPYFPLGPTYRTTLRATGVDSDGDAFSEESRLSFGGLGPVIAGVQTTIQRDRAFESGKLVEDTFDYYAQDTSGNVWYLGEDVTNYVYDDDGNLVETNSASSWIAGENDALPGYIMPSEQAVGFAYFQESAPKDAALDEAMIFGTGLTIEVGGTLFTDVLAIYETTALDPDARELKYYAPSIGIIRVDEGLSVELTDPELVFERVSPAPVPLPAGLPLLLAGLVVLGLRTARRA